jgi:DNA-binding transcriptional MerR regulator
LPNRIHEEPDPRKIMAFAEFAKNLGYPLKGIKSYTSRRITGSLDKVKGSREEMTSEHRSCSDPWPRQVQPSEYRSFRPGCKVLLPFHFPDQKVSRSYYTQADEGGNKGRLVGNP